jgi:hypothetical protein
MQPPSHPPWSARCLSLPFVSPAAGGAIFKGLQRLTGTVLMGLLGVGTQYTVYLINGLTYDNSVLKFAAMTVRA